MINFRPIFVVGLVILLLIPVILQYIYGWGIHFRVGDRDYNVSVYGFYLLGYMVLQFVFALANNLQNSKQTNRVYETQDSQKVNLDRVQLESNAQQRVNIIVVGYREDPEYFKGCLESIRTISTNVLHLNKIFVIVDGDEAEDNYMVETFFDVFENSSKTIGYIHLTVEDTDITDEILTLHMSDVRTNDIICISQKHSGKRSAMMTGFRLTLLDNLLFNTNIGFVFCTDSDTVVNPECVNKICERFVDPRVGAVAGDLGIYNRYDSVVAFMSSVRYWYAFNLERAYQSFTGSVLCVSGPVGMYRVNDLERVVDEWNGQTFLGKRCTYGDDRHLTNKILGLGKDVVYNQNAYAETETPSSWYRFFQQQTRWNKSAFREFFWSIGVLGDNSLFMTVDLVYVLLYPYIVMGYLLYILWYKTTFELGIYMIVVLLMGIIKSIYGVLMSNSYETGFYFMYVFIYVTTIFPAKLWALINIGDNSWGTVPRNGTMASSYVPMVVPMLWNGVLVAGFVYNLWHSFREGGVVLSDYLLLVISVSVWCLAAVVMMLYINIRANSKQNLQKFE